MYYTFANTGMLKAEDRGKVAYSRQARGILRRFKKRKKIEHEMSIIQVYNRSNAAKLIILFITLSATI